MDKSGQRKEALAARASLSEEERAEKSRKISEALLELPEVKKASVIFSYMAIKDEADLKLLNEHLSAEGKTLCFPVSERNGIMRAYAPGKWRKGLYGIVEPEPESSVLVEPERISLVLSPCLGFDEKGNRLGYGGGYYDRFLPSCANAKVIVCAYEAQKFGSVIADELDRRANIAVTEEKIYRF